SNTATLDTGFDGIAVGNLNAANTQLVQVDNTGTINANLNGGGGFGIFATQAGDGGILINNGGLIGGTAEIGIFAISTGALGGVTILNTGAGIGSPGDPVNVGIGGQATNGASV